MLIGILLFASPRVSATIMARGLLIVLAFTASLLTTASANLSPELQEMMESDPLFTSTNHDVVVCWFQKFWR